MLWREDICDRQLLNIEEFGKALDKSDSTLQLYKQALLTGSEYLNKQFESGESVKDILYRRAWLIDQLLISIWRRKISSENISLIAVGGYGRGELHPCSDIDLMILTSPRIDKTLKREIEKLITFFWDIGLEVGHSVRNIKECVKTAKSDISVATNLMEARLVVGSERLFDEMRRLTGPKKIWPSRKFFQAKWSEQIARYQKFDGTEHKLEPNIKEGPGGLRDIQVVDWVAKRHFSASRLSELVKHNFLTKDEYNILAAGRDFLWRVRFILHTQTGRHEDRLLFDHQRNVAKAFGFETKDNSGVEQFMKVYHRTVRELGRLNEMLLQHFQEAIIYAKRREKIKPINKRFQIRNDFIEACNSRVFIRWPSALLELFLLIQQNENIKGVRASTIRLVRESIHLIDENYRNDLRNQSLFLEIMRQPRHVGHELRRMHRYGVLSAYLPEFSEIEGLMQFDLFHVYTVDEHILFVVRNMRLFEQESTSETFPLCKQVLKEIPKQELLYLAGMFHDIAKGRGGSHADLGADDALRFCRNHKLPEFDSRLVAWLVRSHLFMAKTAQRKDINDPDVINDFALIVGDVMHLNYLYLLTVADISGTNPLLWNSWKDALIADLYDKTKLALRRGLENPIDKTERISETKKASLDLIESHSGLRNDPKKLWDSLGEDYFIRYSPDEIAWHTEAITKASPVNALLIAIREKTFRGGSEIFIYTEDRKKLFSRTTHTLDNLGLNVVDARIITSSSNYTLDTFIVLEKTGEIIKGKERVKEIRTALTQQLSALDKPIKELSRVRSRKLKHFPISTRVFFTNDEKNSRTIMEVTTTDRPGILSSIGMAMEYCGVTLQGAKIATYGERVEDIFFITDEDNKMVTDEIKIDCLRNTIIDSLTNG
ncbi:MAG: [protein-PII] uridylyltransferase [Gammaproteobacteria bacterium]|jgi:[protein-PII] uridylyltransferase